MTKTRSGSETNGDGHPWLALAIILGFSLLLGLTLQRGLDFYQPPSPITEIKTARWIGAGASPPVLLLRRSWTIATYPRSAILEVSATDSFKVYVNGSVAATGALLGGRPATLVDVSRDLRPGPNVLAIEVKRRSSGSNTSAAVRLSWDEAGVRQSLVSDGSWLAQTKFLFDADRVKPWFDAGFDASRWPPAREIAGIKNDSRIAGDSLPPKLVNPPPDMIAFWHADRMLRIGSFSLSLPLDVREIHGAWIGVATAGVHTLTINGVTLQPRHGSGEQLEIYDLAVFLQPGANIISLQVTASNTPALVTVAGRVVTSQESLEIGRFDIWKVAPNQTVVTDLPVADPPPSMTFVPTVATMGWQLRHVMMPLLSSVVLALVIGLIVRFSLGCDASSAAWTAAVGPMAVASVPLLIAGLVELDPRWSLGGEQALAVATAALVVALVAATARAAEDRAKEHGTTSKWYVGGR